MPNVLLADTIEMKLAGNFCFKKTLFYGLIFNESTQPKNRALIC